MKRLIFINYRPVGFAADLTILVYSVSLCICGQDFKLPFIHFMVKISEHFLFPFYFLLFTLCTSVS